MKLLRHPHIVRLYQVGSILLPDLALYLIQAKLYVTEILYVPHCTTEYLFCFSPGNGDRENDISCYGIRKWRRNLRYVCLVAFQYCCFCCLYIYILMLFVVILYEVVALCQIILLLTGG
jgi:hypothetical protein